MENREKLSGIFPPCVTVFENEQVSYDKLTENIERYNETNIRGFMPCGTNGEFRSLTDEESVKVVATYGRYRGRDKIILAGAARESVVATTEFIKKIADTGADFVSILPPHYFAKKMTDDVLIRYFTAVADMSPLPVLLYNVPKFTAGVALSPNVIAALAPHPNILGMKDTSSADIVSYIRAVPDGAEFFILAGTIKKYFQGLTHGAVGGVLSIADYLPELCSEIQEIFDAGKTHEAEAKAAYANKLSDDAAGKYGVAGVKAAMDITGYHGGDPRLPLLPLTDAEKAALKAVLAAEGYAE